MRKHLIVLWLLNLVFFTQAFAQDPQKQAEIILKNVSEKYRSFKTLKADFVFTLESRSDDFKEEQKGTIYLQNNNFKLVIGEQQIICDNQNIWTYIKDANEVQINKYDPSELEMNPAEMFTMYEKGFVYALMGEKIKDGRVLQIIELTPDDKSQSFFKVRLYIDKQSSLIVKSSIFEKTGIIYSYEIVKLEPNICFNDDFFKFRISDYPGIVIVDLR